MRFVACVWTDIFQKRLPRSYFFLKQYVCFRREIEKKISILSFNLMLGDEIVFFSFFDLMFQDENTEKTIISHGRVRKNQADSHENYQDREFSLNSVLNPVSDHFFCLKTQDSFWHSNSVRSENYRSDFGDHSTRFCKRFWEKKIYRSHDF